MREVFAQVSTPPAGEAERPDLGRRAAAEGLGAFALVFAGCGAIVTDSVHAGSLGAVGVSLVFGLVIMAMVYATGHLSGAHLNPAVTLAFALTRHFPRREALAYIGAQLLGAIAAALLLLAVWPSQPAALGTTLPRVGAGSALVYEAVLTAFLMFMIMAVATDTRAVGAGAAIAIGGAVGLDALFGGPITGASMNPARSIGPALVSGELHDLWIYIVAPIAGAALGALAYQLVRGADPTHGQPRRPDGARPLRLPAQRRPLADERGALRRAAAGHHEARSAGTEPGERVHPEVVEAMNELGVDLADRAPRKLTDADAEWADVVVTMGCGDKCPYIPGKRYLDWDLEDPKGRPLEEVRRTREEIERRVVELIGELDD